MAEVFTRLHNRKVGDEKGKFAGKTLLMLGSNVGAAAYSYPLNISSVRLCLVKKEVSRLVKCGKIKYGAMNIEMVITKHNLLYFLDVGPCNGGNMFPKFIGYIKNQDFVKATIWSAIRDYSLLRDLDLDGFEGEF